VDELRLERARSFGSVADRYERARPGYPEEAVEWLVGAARRVVDLGAGTGKLARQLVARGLDVTAVEPSAEMLDQLRAAVPGARAVRGTAEQIPVEDASADAVVVAQAFHWFDAQVALREIARVLRAGGVLGLVWNDRDEAVPWAARLSEIIREERLPSGEAPPDVIPRSGRFGAVEWSEFRFEQDLDRETLLDLVLSRSYVAAQNEAGRAAVLARVSELFDEVAREGRISLPYVTSAYRTLRNADD
jgi:ubiquinone/menaquinone biosynthesis C-methylase UbiE